MRPLVDSRRLAGRTARIGTVSSKAEDGGLYLTLSSGAKSHAGAWAIPRCSRTPIRICTNVTGSEDTCGIARLASCPDPKVHGCTDKVYAKSFTPRLGTFSWLERCLVFPPVPTRFLSFFDVTPGTCPGSANDRPSSSVVRNHLYLRRPCVLDEQF